MAPEGPAPMTATRAAGLRVGMAVVCVCACVRACVPACARDTDLFMCVTLGGKKSSTWCSLALFLLSGGAGGVMCCLLPIDDIGTGRPVGEPHIDGKERKKKESKGKKKPSDRSSGQGLR